MIALPSIAFGGFSGSAKGVTARQVGGRSILSLRCWPTGLATSAQVARRASMGRITKKWQTLTAAQMAGWDSLAEHCTGASVLGTTAEISGLNLFIRLNVARVMAGESMLLDAPENVVALPLVEYDTLWITPKTVIIKGIVHETSPLKLVIKMSGGQSAGVSSGWSKAVILSPGMEDDWGDADMTSLYFKTIGVKPVVGEKIFLEMYWLDTETGFTGQVSYDSAICITEEEAAEEGYVARVKYTMNDLDETKENHVSALDVDFSTGAPVISFNAVCLGHSNVASSEVYLDTALPTESIGTGICVGRSADGTKINAQSYLVYMYNRPTYTQMTFAHRGGYYVKPTEIFGAGVVY